MIFQHVIEFINAASPIVAALAAVWAVKLGRTIHSLVNSNLHKVQSDLAVATARIGVLEAYIVAQDKDAKPQE